MKPVSFLCYGLRKRRLMSQARRTRHFCAKRETSVNRETRGGEKNKALFKVM